jgi:trimeric autotransporter adhesin
LDILGAHVVAQANPVFTTGATNVVTINVQAASAQGASSATNMGLASFNSANFTVDANGFVSAAGGGTTETLTGNTGGAISPIAGNINTVGTGSITIAGAGNTLTTQLTGLTNHDVLVGAGTATITSVSPSTAGFVLTSNGVGADPSFQAVTASGAVTTITGNSGGAEVPLAGNFNVLGIGSVTVAGSANTETVQLTGLTNHSVQVGAGTATLTQLAVGTNGQVLIGATAADPAFATLTSSDSSITFTTGANTLSLQVAGGTTSIKTITGNTGGAESPLAGNFNILGTGSITVAGTANTETVQLTGLTNHALQIGAGTATLTQLGAGTTGQVLQTNTGADPTWSTATYPSTTTINQLLYSSATNVVSGLATANQGVLTTGATGIPVITALATNGQIIIGSTAGVPAAATLTAGTGVSIVNGSNSITIAATGGSFAWVDVTTATQTLAVQTGYVTDHTNVTYTLPATAALGDQIRIVGKLGITTIAQNAGQQILVSSASSTVGVTGSVVGTNVGDCIWLVCITAGSSTVWRAESFVGNLTVT